MESMCTPSPESSGGGTCSVLPAVATTRLTINLPFCSGLLASTTSPAGLQLNYLGRIPRRMCDGHWLYYPPGLTQSAGSRQTGSVVLLTAGHRHLQEVKCSS